MEERTGLLFLMVLGAAWACDAKELENPDLWMNDITKSEASGLNRKQDVCALCEQYSGKALDYLTKNETQDKIVDILHNTCHHLYSFEQQCLNTVDHYAFVLFSEVASIQPREFCKTVNLCQQIVKISSQVQEDSCGFCKDTISALLVKMKDPDTEIEIIQTLLKLCNSMDKYAKKCKMLVSEYGPMILMNAEKFLETRDICTALHYGILYLAPYARKNPWLFITIRWLEDPLFFMGPKAIQWLQMAVDAPGRGSQSLYYMLARLTPQIWMQM